MARQNPLTEIDQQIGQRLRQFRVEKTGLTAAEFARRLGIDSNRLATYEHGRVPIRFDFAHSACREFNICQRWIAEGIEPARHNIGIPRELLEKIPKRSLFSSVYGLFLKKFIERYFDDLKSLWGGKLDQEGLKVIEELGANSIRYASEIDMLHLLFRNLVRLADDIPPDLYQAFFSRIIRSSLKFRNDKAANIEAWRKTPKTNVIPEWISKSSLTVVSEFDNNCRDMKAQLPALLKRLNEATSQRGTKTTLAKFMGVSLPNVSQWLSGEKEPGGEYTLKLLHWVEQQERQK